MKFAAACLVFVIAVVGNAAQIEFWDKQQKGTNFFNKVESVERFRSARDKGIRLVRLTPSKWKAAERDFLIGNADEFKAIPLKDFQQLKNALDEAATLGMKVIVTPLSLPGARWRQQNGNKSDLRLWRDKKYHQQSAQFWKELASLLKDHPAVAAYDLLNEPHPELVSGNQNFWTMDFAKWYQTVEGTAADLNLFHQTVVSAIRQVDKQTPIVVETGLWATPWAITYVKPLNDSKVIYSIHMYEPYEYTNKPENKGRYRYPGKIENREWNRQAIVDFFAPVVRWQKAHGIAPERIFVGEFGVNRTLPGAATYLQDILSVINQHGWHWAFYSFREDTWAGMDYEVGTGALGEKYWKDVARGKAPTLPRRENALTQVLFREFRLPAVP